MSIVSTPASAEAVNAQLHQIEGGITAPLGFLANGIHVGLKKRRNDLSLIVSETPAHFATVVTTNIVKAAPILWTQNVLAAGTLVKAIIVNSGNANACTGTVGTEHTCKMAQATAEQFDCGAEEIIVASTGVIGVPMPIEKILEGIPKVAQLLEHSTDAAHQAAEGIMTTDTYSKEVSVEFQLGGKTVKMGAMAKGSGMIHPNMATMLGFVTTDANIAQNVLQMALKECVDDSYHMISVDGDTSTNDMVAVLANGLAGNAKIDVAHHPDYPVFAEALRYVCQNLAQQIAKDGEGATKFLSAHVEEADSKQQARVLAKAIVSSSLVKSAFFGEDANWGRIISSMGATGVAFDPENVSLTLSSSKGNLLMLQHGEPKPFSEEVAKEILSERDIDIHVQLHSGEEQATAWGCDLSHEYVTINSSYRS
jgi:glutamate N-acetyltransferase / amino-acid N-acetyltransferase